MAGSGAIFTLVGYNMANADSDFTYGTLAGIIMFLAGGVEVLSSIPFFLSSQSHKKKFSATLSRQEPVTLAPNIVSPGTAGVQLKFTIPLR